MHNLKQKQKQIYLQNRLTDTENKIMRISLEVRWIITPANAEDTGSIPVWEDSTHRGAANPECHTTGPPALEFVSPNYEPA